MCMPIWCENVCSSGAARGIDPETCKTHENECSSGAGSSSRLKVEGGPITFAAGDCRSINIL